MQNTYRSETFLHHFPPFAIWFLVTVVVTGCGAAIADALELRGTSYTVLLLCSVTLGMVIGGLVLPV